MKTAGPRGEPAALLSGLATDSIPQTHPFPNSPSTAGAPAPLDAARLPVLGELDGLIVEFPADPVPVSEPSLSDARRAELAADLAEHNRFFADLLAELSPTPEPAVPAHTLTPAAMFLASARSRAANFVNPPMSRSARSRQLARLLRQGFEEQDILKIQAAEDAHASVRGSLQHLSTTHNPSSPETMTIAKRPAASISARAIAARNTTTARSTRTTPGASKTKRHNTSDARLAAYHDALASLGHPVAVTARLRPDIEAKMRRIGQEDGDPLDWLRRAINRELGKLPGAVLGSVWLMGVISKGGDAWHPHGELAVADLAQLPAIKAAILRAVGVSPNKRFRRRQVKIKSAWSAGWLGLYGEQNIMEARRAGVPGSLVVVSGNVKSATTKATRAFWKSIKARQRSSSKDSYNSLMADNHNDAAAVAQKSLAADSLTEQNNSVQSRIAGSSSYQPKTSPRGCPSRHSIGLPKLSRTRHRRGYRSSILTAPWSRPCSSPASSPTIRPIARSTGPPLQRSGILAFALLCW